MAVRVAVYGTADLKQIERARKELDRLQADATKSSAGFSGAFKKMSASTKDLYSAVSVTGAAVVAAAVGAYKSLQAYAESEKVQINLERAVKNTGATYSSLDGQIQKVISSQSMLAAVDDEEVSASMTKLVQMTGNVTDAMKLNALALDVSRATGKDLASSAMVLGKVYNGNVGALKKFGISVKDGATATEALAQIQQRYGGAAEAYGRTTAAAADRMAIAWENLGEAAGEFAVKVLHLPDKMNVAAAQMQAFADKDYGRAFKLMGMSADEAARFLRNEAEATAKAAESKPILAERVKTLKDRYDEYTAAVDEASSALAASQDAELASLRSAQKLDDAKKNLKQTIKEHGKNSRETRIAELELAQAERENAAAAQKAKEEAAKLKSANDALSENDALIKYLEKLYKKLKNVGSAAATTQRRINSIKNPTTASGGVRANASGSIVTSPTLTWVGEAGDSEAIIPLNKKSRSYELLAYTMKAMGVGNASTGTAVDLRGAVFGPGLTKAQVQGWILEAISGNVRSANALGRM